MNNLTLDKIKEQVSCMVLGKEQSECLKKINSVDIDTGSANDLSTIEKASNEKLTEVIVKHINVPDPKQISDNKTNNVFFDLEMFESYDNDIKNTVFYSIDTSHLVGGSLYLKNIISNPISNITILKKRQKLVKQVANNMMTPELQTSLNTLKENEDILEWLHSMDDSEMHNLYSMVYFNTFFTKKFNNSSYALYGTNLYRIIVSPTVGIISPIAYFMIPYLILRFKMKIRMPFITYIRTVFLSMFKMNSFMPPRLRIVNGLSYAASLFFYFQGIINSFEISHAVNSISKFLTNKMNRVITYIKHCESIVDAAWDESIPDVFFGCKDSAAPLVYNEYSNIKHEQKYSLFNNFGDKLKSYKYFNTEKYHTLIRRTYMIDAVYSIYRMHRNFGFSFSKYYTKRITPRVNIKQLWHPCVPNPIKNDVKLDNLIITGPNAGGKSTLIKSMLLNIVLSQTLCVANSSFIKMTPFVYMNSQMNVPDCKGKESLFEAEMKRSKYNLDKLKEIDGDGFSLMIMDEIFNSTNPVEGISGAYAIMKAISAYKTNLMVFTTHYVYLTNLSKECNFRNMRMSVNINKGDDDKVSDISFPFILSDGVCRQYIALDLLKLNGFDADLIDNAIEIKKKFVE